MVPVADDTDVSEKAAASRYNWLFLLHKLRNGNGHQLQQCTDSMVLLLKQVELQSLHGTRFDMTKMNQATPTPPPNVNEPSERCYLQRNQMKWFHILNPHQDH